MLLCTQDQKRGLMAGIQRQNMPRQPKRYGASGKEIARGGSAALDGGMVTGHYKPYVPPPGSDPTRYADGSPVIPGQHQAPKIDRFNPLGGSKGGFVNGDPSQGSNIRPAMGGDNIQEQNPNEPWRQGGGTTRPNTPYMGGSWGGQGVNLPRNPYMANGHQGSTDGVLAMQQAQNAQRNTGSAQQLADTRNAAINNRYSVGPYGALVAPNSTQINPTTGAPMTPVAGGGGFANYNSSMTASSGGLGSAADYNAKYNEAKQANLDRYAEGKGELSSLRDRSMGYLEGAGQQEQADIRQSGDAAKAASGQKLQGLGLAGTTIGQTTNSGIDRETNDSLSRSNERINQQKLGTDSATTNNLTGFIERRTDAYPDMNVYAQLAMSQSANGGSGGQATGGSYGGMNPQTGQQGGGQRTFINNSQGYGPITGANFTQHQAPTGVNLDYLTGTALNDPEYMKAFGNTPMKKSPKYIFNQQPNF